MIGWPGAKAVSLTLRSSLNYKNVLLDLFIFLISNNTQYLYLSKPVFYQWNFPFFKITAKLIHDVRHKIAPTRIQNQFQDISNIHLHYTRSSASNNFYTQSSRLSIKLNSFTPTGSTIWNGIPWTLRSLRNNDFTRKITTLLFDILISEDSYLETYEIVHRIKHIVKWYCDLYLE